MHARTTSIFAFVVSCTPSSPSLINLLDSDASSASGFDAANPDNDASAQDLDGGMTDPVGTWRSELFPPDWRPIHAGGARGPAGRFLPDVSAAGWHLGQERPPVGQGAPTVVVPSWLADGMTDATSAIQAALDTACRAGGGVVFLPAGTYRLRLPQPEARAALNIQCSHVVMRGEGPLRTRLLFDDPTRARSVAVIRVRGEGSLRDGGELSVRFAEDAPAGARTVHVVDASNFEPGQLIVVRNVNTPAFRAEHRMDEATAGSPDLWPPETFWGLAYPRGIVRIDGNVITLDAPIHYALRVRDEAKVEALPPFIEEVGLESFAIGMIENLTTPDRAEPESDQDYTIEGTTGYEVSRSHAVELDAVHDAWIHDVDSFAPAANTTTGSHLLSNGFLLEEGAFRITVTDCDLARPQYRGGGGNGYLLHLQGHNALVVDSVVERARHGMSINHAASGNVLLRVTAAWGRYSDDTHRFLANANLYDNVRLVRSWLQAVNRGVTSSGAGFTATGNVFWRTHVISNHSRAKGCALESAQWGHGYLIGSSAEAGAQAHLCPTSFTNTTWSMLDSGDPTDFVEGEGRGDSLRPISLFAAQLAYRCERDGLSCPSW